MKISKLSELTPDPCNANKGTQRGRGMLEKSLREAGAGRSIVVDRNNITIGGAKTLEVAVESGFEDAIVVDSGEMLVLSSAKPCRAGLASSGSSIFFPDSTHFAFICFSPLDLSVNFVVTLLAKCYPVGNVKPQVWVFSPCLDVMGLKIASFHLTMLARVGIPLIDRVSPLLVFVVLHSLSCCAFVSRMIFAFLEMLGVEPIRVLASLFNPFEEFCSRFSVAPLLNHLVPVFHPPVLGFVHTFFRAELGITTRRESESLLAMLTYPKFGRVETLPRTKLVFPFFLFRFICFELTPAS